MPPDKYRTSGCRPPCYLFEGATFCGLGVIWYAVGVMTLLEQALEKVAELPADEQEAIASQILDSLADEAAWKNRFAAKRDRLRQMAQEALEEDERGETRPLDDLL